MTTKFTEEYFEKLSGTRFINIDGKLYFAETNLGGPSYEKGSDTFELINSNYSMIEFDLIEHYYRLLNPNEIFTETYTIKMELTDDGWRFSLFELKTPE